MARTCPTGFDSSRLREHVLATYERVAHDPRGEFHFHRGRRYAVELLGYDDAQLRALPELSTSRFAGVGNPLSAGPIHPGETVLDHACGAGMDLLLAAQRVGPSGRAIGVDMTPAMRAVALRAAEQAGLADVVEVRAGVYEALPLDDGCVDVVISNGVVNLAPDKGRVFAEIRRVLKPGGRLYLADVVVARELSLPVRQSPELWAACVAGALPEPELFELAAELGFEHARVVARHDCFRDTSAESRVARDLRVHAVSFYARKPG